MLSDSFMRKFDIVILITEDPSAVVRGYSIIGREFRTSQPVAVKDECITLDGVKFVDSGYLIERREYLRVVPEASPSEYREPFVMIPSWAGKVSFRPKALA